MRKGNDEMHLETIHNCEIYLIRGTLSSTRLSSLIYKYTRIQERIEKFGLYATFPRINVRMHSSVTVFFLASGLSTQVQSL